MERDPHAVVKILARLFRELRIAQRGSLEFEADRAGIHRTHLGLLERGARQPTLSVAIQIARTYGYELSELLAKAELVESGKLDEATALLEVASREPSSAYLRNGRQLVENTGISGNTLLDAIGSAYKTLDMIDAELIKKGGLPVISLVELANFSSMMGNLLGAGLAEHSGGLYIRNKPHAFPDLLPQTEIAKPLEVKMALEKNRPKAHLPKSGAYICFRYVLASREGDYKRGKMNRGVAAWIWEVKVGLLNEADFDLSNTPGDSGKTAVVKTSVFNTMPLVYFDPDKCPHTLRNGRYPGFN